MNDVGGSESGRGLRAVKSSRTSDSNFEYDDSEWDVGIGNLIIDLDADIEKTNEATRSTSGSASSIQTLNRSLPNSQMHIPQSPASSSSSSANNSSSKGKSSTTGSVSGNSAISLTPSIVVPPGKSTAAPSSSSSSSDGHVSTNSVISVSMEHSTMSDKRLTMKIKRSKPGTKSVDAKHEIVKSDVLALTTSGSTSGSSSSSATKSSSSSNNNDSKMTSSSSIPNSQRDGKDSKVIPVVSSQDKESPLDIGSGNDQNSAKAKAAKRTTSTHKKVKLATGFTASIVTTSKKDVDKTSTNVTTTSSSSSVNSSSLGNNNSHGKDNFNNSLSSAFVKTSVGSSIKIPGTILGNNDIGTGTGTTGTPSSSSTTTNCRSLHNSTSHNLSSSSIQLTSGSLTTKGDKITPSSMAPIPTDKLATNSPSSYGKKPRAVGGSLPEKNSSGQESGNTNLGGLSSTSHGYRHLPSSSSNSGNNEGPSSSNSTTVSAAGTGNGNSAGNTVKDSSSVAVNSRVPVQQPISFQDACVGTTVGTVTEPDCLGPCEPGTSVTLEGIVWHETESGVLVVNVTWRGKTYVGTLLDCTKNDWASPRFCDSPTSDLEMRTPKNRGKRGRNQTATPVSDPGGVDPIKPSSTKLRNGAKGRRGSANNAAPFVAPVSPLKPDQWPKRKTRGSENESQEESTSAMSKSAKRLKLSKESTNSSGRQTSSPAPSVAPPESPGGPFSPALIECPEPNCSKKYKHINGLRYHQSHAHSTNFAAEDSDSNMSTASNTNLNSVVESTGANDDAQDSRIDVDAIEGSGAESNSAPSTPVKKQTGKSDIEEKEKVCEGIGDIDMKPVGSLSDRESLKQQLMAQMSLACGVKLDQIGKTPEKEEGDKISEKNENVGSKEKEIPVSGIPSRPPILTVPTLPFMSLQNRTQFPIHRTTHSETSEKSNRDQESNVMTKVGGSSGGTPPSKGIPWQPHAISPFHSQQQNLNIPVTLNVPSRDHDKGFKDSKSSSSSSSSKKSKHKKKSKEKGERDRGDGKSKSSSSDYVRDTIKPGLFSPTAPGITNPISKEKERSVKSEDLSPRRESSDNVGGGHIGGENREDPQSPAYSDISDANDSGPESDMILSGKEPIGKSSVVPELKKDGTGGGGGQGLGSFYSPFYNPMDSPYLGSSNPAGQVKSDRNTSGTGAPGDDPSGEKLKSKPSTLPQHISSAHGDDRRSSPKLDYHHQNKYLPPQQPYYSYHYPNYHFEQPYGLIPENAYSHSRSIMEEKERETEEQRVRLNSKGKTSSDSIKEESVVTPTNLSSVTIKQEPGVDRGSSSKEHHHRSVEDKSSSHSADSKSDFSNEYQESKRHGAQVSHYSHKHSSSKESRREREERHGGKDEGKEPGKISSRSSSSEQNRSKGSESNSEKESSKNEGAKPTMETQGPPPPPTAGSYAYYPPGYLQGNPYSHLPFDPNHHIFRQVMVPSPYPGNIPGYMHPGNIPRFSQPPSSTPLPEDLSRPNPSAAPPKALDLLQHHAAQYYASHKIHELQERALKSPSPKISANQRESTGSNLSGPTNLSLTPSSPSGGLPSQGRGSVGSGNSNTERKQPTDLTKDVKPSSINPLSSGGTESSRSPPIHHVHTHMHSHTHIGYPIIPTVPPQYSPNLTHYGVLTTPASAPPASVIPPFPSQKPT